MEKARRKSSLQLIHEQNLTYEDEGESQEQMMSPIITKKTSEKEEKVSFVYIFSVRE